jgi:hypothetical protein
MSAVVIDTTNGYWFTAADLPALQVASYYPERTTNESHVIRDFLNAHGADFEQIGFSVRVGQALKPDPTHLIGVQKSTIYSSRKRIDVVGVTNGVVTLVEAKTRIEPSALGQILTYRELWMHDNPGADQPHLAVIGRYSDQDTVNALQAHGVDVYIYEAATVV